MPEEATVQLASGARIVWDDLDSLSERLSAAEPTAGWRVDGELKPDLSALRVLTGRTEAGTMLLLAGVRPDGADGHDAERPQAVLVRPAGEAIVMDEALLSTQYKPNGAVARIGLELYAEDDDYPIRGAGDAKSAVADDDEGPRRERTTLDFRLDGELGTALFEILHL